MTTRSNCRVIILFLCFVSLAFVKPIFAEQIYRRQSASGEIIYSSTPLAVHEQPANLPAIERENIGQKIAGLQAQTPPNCFAHGGIACSRGADEDGSVVCLDGNRNAIVTFESACTEARLTTPGLVFLDRRGTVISRKEAPRAKTMQLALRNNSDITARGIKVLFLLPEQRKIAAFGPDEVEPYGIAEYIFYLDELPGSYYPNLVDRVRYDVQCMNCGAVAKNK